MRETASSSDKDSKQWKRLPKELWNIHHSWFLKANVTDVSWNHSGIAGPALGKDCGQVYSSRQSTRAIFLILGDNVPHRQRRLNM